MPGAGRESGMVTCVTVLSELTEPPPFEKHVGSGELERTALPLTSAEPFEKHEGKTGELEPDALPLTPFPSACG